MVRRCDSPEVLTDIESYQVTFPPHLSRRSYIKLTGCIHPILFPSYDVSGHVEVHLQFLFRGERRMGIVYIPKGEIVEREWVTRGITTGIRLEAVEGSFAPIKLCC